jgi:FkbM family methyltransferase
MTRSRRKVTPRFAWVKRMLACLVAGDAVGRLLRSVFGKQIPFHGMRIDVHDGIPPRHLAALFWGLYESAEYRFVRDHLAPNLPALECGAGIGAISSVIAKVLAPGQHIVCIEGNPRLLPLLRANVQRHGSHLQIQIIEGVIGPDLERVDFLISRDNLCSRRVEDPSGDQATKVPSTSLSAAIARRSWTAGWQLVADIEGGEALILKQDRQSLSHCVRMIIELHDTVLDGSAVRVEDLEAAIVGLGFTEQSRYGNVFVFERE